jgi:gamma-glutamylaminecyclotransferase
MIVFIYGTLKRGCSNHRYLAGQDFLGQAATAALYRLYDLGGYPGMIAASPGRQIPGELWQIDEPCRALLDELESVDVGEYQLVPVELSSALPDVMTYLYRWPIDPERELTQW